MKIITPKRLDRLLSLCCRAPRLIAIFAGVVSLTFLSGKTAAQTTTKASSVKEGIIKLADSNIEYFSRGEGETIVLLPGGTLTVDYLDGLAEALAKAITALTHKRRRATIAIAVTGLLLVLACRPEHFKVHGTNDVAHFFTLPIVLSGGGTRIEESDFGYYYRFAVQDVFNVFLGDICVDRNHFSWIDRYRLGGNATLSGLDTIKEPYPLSAKFIGWNAPKILYFDGDDEFVWFIRHSTNRLGLICNARSMWNHAHVGNSHVWSIGRIESVLRNTSQFMGLASLPECQPSIDDYRTHRNHFNGKCSALVGLFFFLGGFVVLYKTWWKISFDLTPNVNISTNLAFILLACILIWIGQWLLLWSLGLTTPLEAFGHTLFGAVHNRFCCVSTANEFVRCSFERFGIGFYPLPVVNVKPTKAKVFTGSKQSRQTPRGVIHNNHHIGSGNAWQNANATREHGIMTAINRSNTFHFVSAIRDLPAAKSLVLKIKLNARGSLKVKRQIPSVIDNEGNRKWL